MIRSEAEKTDTALMRAGRSADSMGDSRAMRSYSNAQAGIRGVRQETDRANSSMGIFRNRWMLITAAVLAAAPAITRAGGVIVQLTGSLVRAAGGAGVIGGGALGIFLTGMLSVVSVAKPMATSISKANKAFDAYNQAVSQYGVRSQQAATGARALNAALKEAPANTLRFITTLEALENQWRRLTRPGQGSLMGFLAYGVGRLQNVAPQLAGIVNRNVAAVAGGGRGFIDRILGPSALADVAGISRYFRQMVPDMAAIAGDVVTIALRLTRDAGPYVRQITHDLREWVDHLDRSTQDTVYMDDRFRRWTSEFRSWLSLLRGTENLLSALLGSATGGQREIAGITAHFNLWAEWIRTNPVKMQRFWQDSTRFARGFGNLLVWTGKLLFTLSDALTPVGRALAEIFKAIGPTFLDTLRQLGILATTVFGGIGGFNGPLAVFLGVVNSILEGVNTLIARIPGLGAVIGGAFVVWGIMQFASWLSTATGRMLGLTAATSAQAAAMERLGWASAGGAVGGAVGGRGGGGRGGLPILVPTGGGGRAGIRSRLSSALRGSPAEIIGRTPSGAFIGAPARAGLMSSAGLAAATRSGRAALRGVGRFAWPIAVGLGAIDAATTHREGSTSMQIAESFVGAAHGATFGLLPNVRGTSATNSAAISAIQGGGSASHVGGHLGWDFNPLHSGPALAMRGGSSIDAGVGLNARLAAAGGTNPRTLRQIGAQIAAYTTALVQARGLSGAAATAFRGEVNSNLQALRTAARQLRAARGHEDFLHAKTLESRLGGAYGIVYEKRGPVAAMQFMVQQAIANFKTLGPRGKKELADSILIWGKEAKTRNPALTGEFNKLRDSVIGSFDSTLAHSKQTNKDVLQGMTMTWPKIRHAMTDPMEKGAELVSKSFTKIQRQAQGALLAMGYTAAQAMNIIRMMETTGLIPQSMIGPVAPGAAQAFLPGGGTFGLGAPASLVSTGRSLQRRGFQVGENAAFGGVSPVHRAHSLHYSNRAIDVNWPGGGLTEYAHLKAAYDALKKQGGWEELLIEDAGKKNQHLHVGAYATRTKQGIHVNVTIHNIHHNGAGDTRRVVANEIKLAIQDVEQHMRSMGTSQPEQAHK